MRLRIDLKIVFFITLFYFTGQLKIYLLILFFALLHELAHLIVGCILGFKVESIELVPIGFFVRIFKSFLRIILGKNLADESMNLMNNISIIILTITGSIVILYLKNIAVVLILAYLLKLVIKENKRYKLKKKILNWIES